MAILKCKMCGGDIEVSADKTYGTCDSCGSTMTLPKIDDDQRANLFNRANRFRQIGEFDKAISAYESILNQDDTDAEAHWCVVLSRFGIEYVVDPASGKRIPTCHRVQTNSILTDADYLSALEHTTDTYTKTLYQEEAARIAEIQKEIIAISANESPYDVFICYKESDENGNRTKDSTLAQDVYYQLTQEGYKVFFARITLESKLGQAYEPYIFAALNSAKVMVVVGSKQEYFNAIWVKNEWSRYLDLMSKDKGKLLIPCYRDMDAYDIPDALSMFQSQDMGKIGFIQDLIRGIRKVLVKEETPVTKVVETVKVESASSANVESLLNRTEVFLEDGEWNSVKEYCDKVLDLDVKCATAYVYLLCAKLNCRAVAGIPNQDTRFLHDADCQKAIRFGTPALKAQLEGYDKTIAERLEENRQAGIYNNGLSLKNQNKFQEAIAQFQQIEGYQDSKEQIVACEEAYKEEIYQAALSRKEKTKYHDAIAQFQQIEGYKDAKEQINDCQNLFALAEEKKKRAAARAKAKLKKLGIIGGVAACVIAVSIGVYTMVLAPMFAYNDAIALVEEGSYAEASFIFAQLGDYKDSKSCAEQLWGEYRAQFIAASAKNTAALNTDGTVMTVGDNSYDQRDTTNWSDIVAISMGTAHTVGLKSDGTVLAVGANYNDQCATSKWRDIVAISAGFFHTVGVKYDGTVLAVGDNNAGQCEVSAWTDIVAIAAGSNHTIGLKSDGTVLAVGNNKHAKCNVNQWADIVAVGASNYHTVGLKADGTVVAVGNNDNGQCEVSDWTDIVAISAGLNHTIGLKSDGTVVATQYTGKFYEDQCEVSSWTDIVAIATGAHHTIGLKSDGTAVATGNGEYGRCDVSDWTDIMVYNN